MWVFIGWSRLGLGAASTAAQYVVTHSQPSHNPVNLDLLLDPLSKSEFLSFYPFICGLVGVPEPGTEVTLEMSTVFLGRSTRGIIEGDSVPQIFIPQLIDLYKQDRFPFDKLISYYPIEEINQAAQDSIDGITVKPVLTFNM